jgi:hypothetical protein
VVQSPELVDRYGAPSRARRPLVLAVIAVLATAGAAWLVWVLAFHGTPQVASELVGYDVRGEHSTTVSFTVVRRSRDVRASCLVRALAADHAVVGERAVPVASGPATRRVTTTLRTERRATSADVVGCTAARQRRPR